GVQWLGIDWDTYASAEKLTAGMHGGPLAAAILDARAAQSSDTSHARPGIVPGTTTAEDVLSKYGIDPADPAAAVRAFMRVIDVTPPRWEWLHPALSGRLRLRWFAASEWLLWPALHARSPCVVHHYFSENTLRRSGGWKGRHRLVATCHQPPSFLQEMRGNSFYRRYFVSLAACDLLVVQTRCHVEPVRAMFPGMRVEYVPLGVDAEHFCPGPGTGAAGRPTVLTVGNWMRDYACWAEAVRRLSAADPAVRFLVIANPNVIAKARERLGGERSNVAFRCGLTDAELLDAYRSADLLYLPLRDAMANDALLEAMAVGLPVVATDLEATRDYLGDTAAAYVPPGDAGAASSAMLELLGNPARRAACGRGTRRLALAQYDWPVIAESYRRLYLSLG
ncbi:MAG: glycosyltransferase family 4 protein, partial [Acidobacteria bacterium]|nr:glycosyltransferase family 4 protein [Acidobacteriota bacterium]